MHSATTEENNAIVILIQSMSINSSMTELETRIRQILCARCAKDHLEVSSRIPERELQFHYLENQKRRTPCHPQARKLNNSASPILHILTTTRIHVFIGKTW